VQFIGFFLENGFHLFKGSRFYPGQPLELFVFGILVLFPCPISLLYLLGGCRTSLMIFL
jgi:hypothetical protein